MSHRKLLVGKHIHGFLKAQTIQTNQFSNSSCRGLPDPPPSPRAHTHPQLPGLPYQQGTRTLPTAALTAWKFRTQRCCLIVAANEISHSTPKQRLISSPQICNFSFSRLKAKEGWIYEKCLRFILIYFTRLPMSLNTSETLQQKPSTFLLMSPEKFLKS